MEGEHKRRLSISIKSEVKKKDVENPRKLILLVTTVRKLVKKILRLFVMQQRVAPAL